MESEFMKEIIDIKTKLDTVIKFQLLLDERLVGLEKVRTKVSGLEDKVHRLEMERRE